MIYKESARTSRSCLACLAVPCRACTGHATSHGLRGGGSNNQSPPGCFNLLLRSVKSSNDHIGFRGFVFLFHRRRKTNKSILMPDPMTVPTPPIGQQTGPRAIRPVPDRRDRLPSLIETYTEKRLRSVEVGRQKSHPIMSDHKSMPVAGRWFPTLGIRHKSRDSSYPSCFT